ncbi:MAG TPA: polyphosphate kinase 2 family protein [Thermoleophilia bacterium]
MKYPDMFRVEPGTRVKLSQIDPDYKGDDKDQSAVQDELAKLTKRLAELQYLMYAECKRSFLIVLQAVDGGGKDGTVNHVIASMNPQGATVQPFKVPSAEDLAHDYLWRIHKVTPAKGRVVVFNRSHYEDVLVVRVHGLVPPEVWSGRYDEINAFEKLLSDNGTHIIKFFLYIDKKEQLARFKQRLEDPAKQWKISESDYKEREFWDAYQNAYEDAISKCSTADAPWYIIPANHKWCRNVAISRILVATMESMGMQFPAPSVNIEEIRRQYHAAKESR